MRPTARAGRRQTPASAPPPAEGAAGARVLTLLSRAYCHLCDDMRAGLAPLASRHAVPVVELDVDADKALEANYGERVPVVLLGLPPDGVELCAGRLDEARVARALAVAR